MVNKKSLGLTLLFSLVLMFSFFPIIPAQEVLRYDHYEITGPAKNDPSTVELKNNINLILPLMEELNGIKSPYKKWDLYLYSTPIDPNAPSTGIGLYRGNGNITFDLHNRAKLDILGTTVHETNHGFNELIWARGELYSRISWWDEGSSEFVAYRVFERIKGFKIIGEEKRAKTAKNLLDNNADLSFMNGFNPYTAKENFSKGYANAYDFIRELHDINPDTLKNFNRIVINKKVMFQRYTSRATYTIGDLTRTPEFLDPKEVILWQNNQMQFILSEAVGIDLHDRFVKRGFRVTPHQQILDKLEFIIKKTGEVRDLKTKKPIRDKFYGGKFEEINKELDQIIQLSSLEEIELQAFLKQKQEAREKIKQSFIKEEEETVIETETVKEMKKEEPSATDILLGLTLIAFMIYLLIIAFKRIMRMRKK